MRSLPAFFLVAALGGLAPAAWSQTNDHLYRSWRWQEDIGSARIAGFAGAFVGLADDVSTVISNPAGLMTLQPDKTEATGNLLRRGAGSVGPGDPIAKDVGVGLLSAARRFGNSWAVGLHFGEPRDFRFDMARYRLADGTMDEGYLDASVRTFGAAAAYQPTRRLRLGAGVQANRLYLDGQDDSVFKRENPVEMTTYTEDTSLTFSLGALYDVTNDLRFGAAFRKGARWEADRFAFVAAQGTVLDPGSQYPVRSPDVLSAGASFRPMSSLLLSGQMDYVLYSQIRNGFEVRQGSVAPAEYRLDDALEPSVGAEWSQKVSAVMLLIRGGLHSQAPGALEYVGQDLNERGSFVGSSRRLLSSLGLSVVMPQSIAFDVGTVFGGDRRVFSVGGRVRF